MTRNDWRRELEQLVERAWKAGVTPNEIQFDLVVEVVSVAELRPDPEARGLDAADVLRAAKVGFAMNPSQPGGSA